MDYLTTKEIAQKWGVSDRRVRMLIVDGKIPGALKQGRSYQIPANAQKPVDGRTAHKATIEPTDISEYLKWGDDVIGLINTNGEVLFTNPDYNEVVRLYTNGTNRWSAQQYTEFLSERVVNRERRDIEQILFRCGLSHYDVELITQITRGIHPKDLLWIANSAGEQLDSVVTGVFDAIFHQRIDTQGDSIDTPEGYNIKRYGVYHGKYGIYKERISPLTTDVESEVAVYLLAERLGVPCCPAIRTGENTVFSEFLYDFSTEYLVHFRRLFDGQRGNNEYDNLMAVRPQYKEQIARMILLDFITRQDDRHLSNIAIKVGASGESFYPLYDNGRSLFYEDTPQMVKEAVEDIALYATGFGYSGTYWDYTQQIAKERGGLEGLLSLDISDDEVAEILQKAEFKDYRFDGALVWITGALEMLRRLVGL